MKFVYHHRTASRDGQSTHIEEMILALRERGCSVSLACPTVESSNSAGGSGGWVGRLKALLPKGLYELAELAYSLVAYRRLSAVIRQSGAEVIYERYNLFLLCGVWAKRRFGLPLILEVNAPMAEERRLYGGLAWPALADWAERYVWRHADYVLPVTQVLAEHIIKCGVPSDRVVVIPNGVRPGAFDALPDTEEAKRRLGLEGRLVIGFTGFVREWDRLDRVVNWMASTRGRFPNTHLLVVGDGPARDEIGSCAAANGLSDHLTFTGAVPREAVPAHAMAFDIALQTALVPYASPLCLFEYLALSKAIVAPDQPNHHEVLRDGIDSVLYDPHSDSGLEQALEVLCSDAELRQRVSAAAGRVVSERGFTWGANAGRVMSLATACLADSTGTVGRTAQR